MQILIPLLTWILIETKSPDSPKRMQLFHGGGGLEQQSLRRYNEMLSRYTLLDFMVANVSIYPQNCSRLNVQKTQCLSCEKGFNLEYGVCVPKTQFCSKLHPTGQICVQCKFGLDIQQGKCVAITTNCEIADINANCVLCRKGFTSTDLGCLPSGEICQLPLDRGCGFCGPGFFSQERRCLTHTLFACNRYNADGRCLQCFEKYKTVQGQCIPNIPQNQVTSAPDLPYESKYSVPIACLVMDSKGCIKCQRNYILKLGFCQPKTFFCESYDSDGICQKCALGTKISRLPGLDIITRVANCYLRCVVDLDHCIDKYPDNAQCNVCEEGYVKTNGGCVAIRDVCLQYDQEYGQCFECATNYYTTKQGTCKFKTLSTCLVWGGSGICYSCVNPAKYMLYYGQCLPKCLLHRQIKK